MHTISSIQFMQEILRGAVIWSNCSSGKGWRERQLSLQLGMSLVYQQVKTEHQWKWDHITTDFVVRLSKTRKGNYTIRVIVDWLNIVTRFLLIRITGSIEKLVEMYIDNIVNLHRVLIRNVLDRDLKFISRFWTTY